MRVALPAQAAAAAGATPNAVIAALINDPAALSALASALARSGLADEVHASIDAAVAQHARGEAGRLLAGVVSTLTGWLIPTAGSVPAKAMVFLNGGSVATACAGVVCVRSARSYDKWDANLFVNGGPTTTFAGPNPPYLTATNQGYNPFGSVSVSVGTSPYSVSAKPYGVTYYVTGGTVTSLAVGGVTLTGITSGPIRVPPQTTFVITHSGAPTVVGFGD